MKDRLIITVSDIDSTKSYNLNKIIKKVILYIAIIAVFAISISFWIISELNSKLKTLDEQSKVLQTQNKQYNLQIKDKIKDIAALGNTLKDIEDILGVKGDDETSLIKRVTLAKLTSAQKMYMLQTIPNGKPLKNITVTASFGWRKHPITKKKNFHNGIDLRAKRKTEVYATADGVVRFALKKNKGNYGRMVIISHNFGFETLYAHLKYVNVKVGDVVKKGQVIAKTGNSGRSSGPHLHYEVRYASKVLNPSYFIKWSMKNYEKIFEKQRRVEWESLIQMINSQHPKLGQQ